MADLTPGTRVHAEFDGILQRRLHVGSRVYLQVSPQEDTSVVYAFSPEKVTITPLDPENWPPQPGDVWEAEGKHYFCVWTSYHSGPGFLLQSEDDSGGYGGDDRLLEFRELNPVLRLRHES